MRKANFYRIYLIIIAQLGISKQNAYSTRVQLCWRREKKKQIYNPNDRERQSVSIYTIIYY